MKHITNYNRPCRTKSFRLTIISFASLSACLLGSIFNAQAQMSSLNAFSPYTMYGLGDMSVGGSAFNRPMGGVGIAQRNPLQFNYLNPASMSAIPRQTAIFNFAGDSKNIYSKKGNTSTSHNTVNIHDLGLAFPLGKNIGLGFSLTPVSSVGYVSRLVDETPDITENIGSTIYSYAGDGGISQVAMSLGIQVARGLSLGASMNYQFGNINRQYNATINPYLSSDVYRSIVSIEDQNISKILFTLGAQYTINVGKEGQTLTLGATYQPKMTASVKKSLTTLTYHSAASDTVFSANSRWNMDMPSKIAAGVFFKSQKMGIGFDYSRQDWTGAFGIPDDQNVTLGTQQDFKFGLSYTPDMYDIRSALKRWTYKIGVRYSENYLIVNDNQLNDVAVSMGVDFSLKRGSFSKIGIGVEYGERGSRKAGMIQERYFNVFAAFSLFGDKQGWFIRPKYN